jgi:hypothetical protein
MLRSTLPCLALAFLLLTCKREEDFDLPPATQEGLSTFGCLIDGQRFVPASRDWLKGSSKARYILDKKTLYVGAGNDKTNQGISIGIQDYEGKPGRYVLDGFCNDLPRPNANCGSYGRNYFSDQDYSTTATHKGFVQITAHTDRFISGTFEFDAYDPKTQKVFKITKGRFDLWYDMY